MPERDEVMTAVLAHVAGGVPVIVTTTHFATHICAERSRRAQELGAAMVMIMPPYHGATIRVTEAGIERFFQAVSDAISIPIMIQDAPVSGTTLSAAFLARLAREVENVSYFKIETGAGGGQAAHAARTRRRRDRGAVGRRGRRSPCWPTSMPAPRGR